MNGYGMLRGRGLALLTALAGITLSLGASEDVIYREDFEHQPKTWCLEDWKNVTTDWDEATNGQWRVVRDGGMDGTGGLQLTLGKGEVALWPLAELFDVAEGEAYRFEAWVNASEFHGRVSVSFAPYDAKIKSLPGHGSVPADANAVRHDGWRRYEGTTTPLPRGAKKARLYMWAREGEWGRVRFDAFRVEKAAVNPVGDLAVSALRGEAADGDVSFAVDYIVNPLKHPASTLTGELEYVGTGGVCRVAMPPEGGVARAALPVRSFALGTNDVRFVLHGKGGIVLGCASNRFARLSESVSRRVTFDRFGRTIVDGRPFLPLGFYFPQRFSVKDIATLTNDAPFNCIIPYQNIADTDGRETLDACERAGIRYIVCLSGYYGSMLGDQAETVRVHRDYVRKVVEKYRNHPAVLAWYIGDELARTHAPLLKTRHELIHSLDADHPTWIVQNRVETVRPLINGYDVIGMDPYPVGTDRPVSLASDWALGARREMYDFRPMWQVVQAFDWKNYGPLGFIEDDAKMPTRAELESMTWQAIASGANGLIYYSYFDIWETQGKRAKSTVERDRAWRDVVTVANAVKEKEAVILSEPGPVVGCPESVVCRTWRTGDGKVHMLVANRHRKQVTGTVLVSGRSVGFDLSPLAAIWLEP